jgi:hypothetical protein
VLWAGGAFAQYYDWGASPVSVRWRQIKTPEVKMIYPSDYEANARRALWYLDTIRPHIDFGFRHGTMSTPVVLHTQNTMGNGMVMWAPKRMELLAAPGASYSEPWLKQLIIHETRHNVQYNNLRRSTTRALTWFLGEQIAWLGVGQFSIFILEGDATMAETEMSAFGRGRQPSWSMHYRAVGNPLVGGGSGSGSGDLRQRQSGRVNDRSGDHPKDRQKSRVGSGDYAGDYWFCGSYRDFVPDHYRLGYQMVGWSYDHYDKFIWDDVAHYVARNPQWVLPMIFGLDKLYDTGSSKMMRATFADLYKHWDSLPAIAPTPEPVPTPETSYTTYQWPLWLDAATLIAFKEDFDRPTRIVRVDAVTGAEEVLAYTGIVSSRPVLEDGVLWWTEFRQSMLWDQKVSSRLCSYDLASGRKQIHGDGALSAGDGVKDGRWQVFYPVTTPDGLAFVDYDYSGRYSIVRGGDRLSFPLSIEICGLAWDDVTGGLYFIGLDDGGMFLGLTTYDDGEGYERLTPSRHITISDLRASGGRLYFGSIASGRDEAHCYDIASGVEFRLSQSLYGSFQPSVSPDGFRAAVTTYDRHGYHLALQNTADAVEQEQRTLPVDLVNPQWKRWTNLPRMDSIVYTPAEAERSRVDHKPRRRSKFLNVFRPHSWLPIGFYPPAAIQEADLTMNLGATVMSQSLLSDMTSWLSYGWSARGGSMVRGGLSYSGLGPVLDVDFTYGGGSQALYGPVDMFLGTYPGVPAGIDLSLKRYFNVNVGASLPMSVSSGYWNSSLVSSVKYSYTNGLILRPLDESRASLTRGVEWLSFSVMYAGQTRMARKEFMPRWGFAAQARYVINPTNRSFREFWSVYTRAYLPGVVRPHSVMLRAAWQQTIGGGDLMSHQKELFPRGATYNFATRRWASGSVDYQLPVWYPEGGISKVVYFKRVRVNLFADYARWQDFSGEGSGGAGSSRRGGGLDVGRWNSLYSYGGDVILDINPIRMPAASSVAVRLTLAKPSDSKGVFFGFGLELPI